MSNEVTRPTYSEVALEWEKYAYSLERRLSREENEHAELQSRCFEGFPSVSDGIFDALKEVQAERDTLRRALSDLLRAVEGTAGGHLATDILEGTVVTNARTALGSKPL